MLSFPHVLLFVGFSLSVLAAPIADNLPSKPLDAARSKSDCHFACPSVNELGHSLEKVQESVIDGRSVTSCFYRQADSTALSACDYYQDSRMLLHPGSANCLPQAIRPTCRTTTSTTEAKRAKGQKRELTELQKVIKQRQYTRAKAVAKAVAKRDGTALQKPRPSAKRNP